jgi:DNA-binding PadR family transcriptional regulator
MRSRLTELEELVMLTLLRSDQGTNAFDVLRTIKRVTGRGLSNGTVYLSLYRLVKKGMVEEERHDKGKARVFYTATLAGRRELAAAEGWRHELRRVGD